MDPRRSEYDARQSLLSLLLTFIVAGLVFGGFYLFSLRAPEVPTGPAIEQSINETALPAPESALVRVPNTP